MRKIQYSNLFVKQFIVININIKVNEVDLYFKSSIKIQCHPAKKNLYQFSEKKQ